MTIILTGTTTTNVVNVWAGTFPGPNGQIAFVSLTDGNDEIYVMNAYGSDQTNLSNNDADDFNPSWSPDGEKIAFASDRDNGNFDIYIMNADGSGLTRLTDDPADDFNPSWSPDGEKIAFASDRDENATHEIYVMNADDGSGQTRLTNNDADDFNPSWSPDGEKIAFSGSRDNNEESGSNFDIFVMNADDGSGQTRLTNNDADDSDLDWGTNTSSPDGDGNGSSTTTSQQASDEVISANTDHNTNYNTDDNTNYNTDDNNHDILGFLIAVVQCFTDNDEEFSDDVQLCLYGVIDDYFDNVDNNLNNDNDGRDYNNNNDDISSNDNK